MGVANGGLWEQFLSCQAPNQYGSWGVLEYMEQDHSTAPKHQALQNYINRCVFRHLQPVCRMYMYMYGVESCSVQVTVSFA